MNTLDKLNKIYYNIEKIEEDINPESDLRSHLLEITDSEVDIDIDLDYSFENIWDKIDDAIHEIEVIYYSNAMEFLSNNDRSLTESMEIAEECGFETKDINSELLATLLKQKLVSDDIDYSEFKERFEFYQDIYNKMQDLPSLDDVEGDIMSTEEDEDNEPLIEDIYFSLDDILELTEEIIEEYKD
jgi:hypothetical protein